MKDSIKQPEILANVHLSAKKTGLDTMTNHEILAEVVSYRKENKKK